MSTKQLSKETLLVRDFSFMVDDNVLLDIDHLSASSGDFIALLGANGAGKSTLFKALTGELSSIKRHSSIELNESVQFHQKPIKNWTPNALARHLGVLAQHSQLSFPFTVKEVVSLGLIPLTASKEEGTELVESAMRKTDTKKFSDRSYTQLSGGERQRVHLARVLVQLSQAEVTPVLLLDEPTSAQDLGQQHQILAMAKSLCQDAGWIVIVILHDLNQALRYCDQAWLLKNGRVVNKGTPNEVLQPEQVENIWGYQPEMAMSSQGHQVLI